MKGKTKPDGFSSTIENIKSKVKNNKALSAILDKDDINVVLDFDKIASLNYTHSSYDIINDIVISKQEFPSPNARLVKLVETADKLYVSLFEAISQLDQLSKTPEDEITIEMEYERLIVIRTIKGILKEIKATNKIIQEQMKELNIDDLSKVDWDKVKITGMLENADAILDYLEQNKGQIPQGKLTPQDAVLIEKARKMRNNRSKIIKPNSPKIVSMHSN